VKQIIYNGKVVNAGRAIITSGSRGLRFGDGCFETMKAVNKKIILKDLHFGRLLASLDLLEFNVPEDFAATIQKNIDDLLTKNKHVKEARIRLTIFRGDGGLYDVSDNAVNYVIETGGIESTSFNDKGLAIDVYTAARKQCDHFSHIKSNNFLQYAMAARWAKAHDLDDAILLNPNDRIADATIANVFIVKDGIIRTPVLSEGCISGVMRKFLVNACRKEGIPVEETPVTADDLQNASEVFLTNAIRGIQWVGEIGEHSYTCQVSKLLYNKLVKPLWT
jgi:branched-subunit amino acid aminotransferase/4-amino-4-deoxychorismate lyase